MSESKVAYRYTGKGDYHNGIPTRNLTDADVAALDKDDRKILAESPIYRAVSDEKPKTEKETKSDPPAKVAEKE